MVCYFWIIETVLNIDSDWSRPIISIWRKMSDKFGCFKLIMSAHSWQPFFLGGVTLSENTMEGFLILILMLIVMPSKLILRKLQSSRCYGRGSSRRIKRTLFIYFSRSNKIILKSLLNQYFVSLLISLVISSVKSGIMNSEMVVMEKLSPSGWFKTLLLLVTVLTVSSLMTLFSFVSFKRWLLLSNLRVIRNFFCCLFSFEVISLFHSVQRRSTLAFQFPTENNIFF